jgi:hypothetical protein
MYSMGFLRRGAKPHRLCVIYAGTEEDLGMSGRRWMIQVIFGSVHSLALCYDYLWMDLWMYRI